MKNQQFPPSSLRSSKLQGPFKLLQAVLGVAEGLRGGDGPLLCRPRQHYCLGMSENQQLPSLLKFASGRFLPTCGASGRWMPNSNPGQTRAVSGPWELRGYRERPKGTWWLCPTGRCCSVPHGCSCLIHLRIHHHHTAVLFKGSFLKT